MVKIYGWDKKEGEDRYTKGRKDETAEYYLVTDYQKSNLQKIIQQGKENMKPINREIIKSFISQVVLTLIDLQDEFIFFGEVYPGMFNIKGNILKIVKLPFCYSALSDQDYFVYRFSVFT